MTATAPSLNSARRIASTAGGAFAAFYIFYTSAPTTLSTTGPSAGVRVGIVMLIVIAVQPLVPILSRWVTGQQRLVASAIAVMGIGSAMMPFAGHWPGMVLLGAGFGIFVVTSTAWIKNIAPAHLLGKALGVYGFGSAIGGALGAPISLYLADAFGTLGTALTGSLLAFISLLPTLRLNATEQAGGVGRIAPLDSRATPRTSAAAIVLSLGTHLIAVTVYAAVLSGVSLTTGEPSTAWLPIVAAFMIQSSLAVGRVVGGWVVSKTSALQKGMLALALVILGASGFLLAPAPAMVLAMSVIVGCASGATQTIALTVLMNRARSAVAVNRASAAWNICFDLGLGMGALAIGAIVVSH